jgi:hypothetical protein
MKVHLKGVKDNDAVIVIECTCGNKRMLNEADNLIREETYINRSGTSENVSNPYEKSGARSASQRAEGTAAS